MNTIAKEKLWPSLRCPACRRELESGQTGFICMGCLASYPVLGEVPVLLLQANGLLGGCDIPSPESANVAAPGWKRRLMSRLPKLNCNFRASSRLDHFGALLVAETPSPKVLVIGCGMGGQGMRALASRPIELIQSDVVPGNPRLSLICDAHDLPLADGSVDGVILQAVLDDLVDPARCVAEVHRVLRPDGLVYVETPFMQPVHDGWTDFTRFSLQGLRRLFRCYDEVESGAAGGPAMALALMYQSLLLSTARRSFTRAAMLLTARLTGFWLKYLDRWLLDRPEALDSASAVYLIARRADQPMPDDLLRSSYLRRRIPDREAHTVA